MKLFFSLILLCLTGITFGQSTDDRMSEEDVVFQDKFIEAKGYLLLDRPDKSEDILLNLYKEDRTNTAVSMELANLYGLLDDPYKQHRYAKIASENSDGNEYIIKKYAEVCLETAKYDEAVVAYKELVLKNPKSEEYSDKLATAYLHQDEEEKAIQTYDRIENQIGVTQEISRRKFEIYDLKGDKKGAIKELEKLIESQPANLNALHTLAKYLENNGKSKEAKIIYKNILAIDINDTQANIRLMGDADQPANDSNYLRALSPIIDNEKLPINNKIIELIPYIEKLNNDYDENLKGALLELSHRLVAIHPKEAKSHAMLADVLYISGMKADAIKAYEKTLTIDNRIYTVWEQLMYAYKDIGDYKSLSSKAEIAVDLFPNKASAFYLYGFALRKNKKFDLASNYLSDGVLISGKDLVLKSNILSELARTHLASKNIELALSTVESAIKYSDGKNPIALETKGDILITSGNKKEAIMYWQRSIEAGNLSSLIKEKITKGKLIE